MFQDHQPPSLSYGSAKAGKGKDIRLTTTMEVEMNRPHFSYSRLFSRRYVYTDIDVARIFFPPWDRGFSYSTHACRRRGCIAVKSGEIGADDVDVG